MKVDADDIYVAFHEGRISSSDEYYPAAAYETLEAEVARLRKALEKISQPIEYFMQKAKDGNLEIDPHYVLQLADNAGWLRDIAKAALEASDG